MADDKMTRLRAGVLRMASELTHGNVQIHVYGLGWQETYDVRPAELVAALGGDPGTEQSTDPANAYRFRNVGGGSGPVEPIPDLRRGAR